MCSWLVCLFAVFCWFGVSLFDGFPFVCYSDTSVFGLFWVLVFGFWLVLGLVFLSWFAYTCICLLWLVLVYFCALKFGALVVVVGVGCVAGGCLDLCDDCGFVFWVFSLRFAFVLGLLRFCVFVLFLCLFCHLVLCRF